MNFTSDLFRAFQLHRWLTLVYLCLVISRRHWEGSGDLRGAILQSPWKGYSKSPDFNFKGANDLEAHLRN